MHSSIRMEQPIEIINITPFNPLISRCQIKVCYVGDTPNRNGSVITKEVAKEMANSLPGSPIVGYYNETKEDFEEHNKVIDISNGKFEIKDTTKPYGFVDLEAKVWFQKFLDDGKFEHEYLMTEGWLWTGQYPECQRIINNGNNQSMELDDKTLNGTWSKSNNTSPELFIINEAIISKLCILGEENEPCFEGAEISAPFIQFSFEEGFKKELFSMMSELKNYLNEGGKKVITKYAVKVGDSLWNALYTYLDGKYEIESVCEEDEQKFAVVVADNKYYRLNFSIDDNNAVEFSSEYNALEDYTPAEEPQFNAEDIEKYKESLNPEQECENCDECDCEKDKKVEYNLEEIQEYVELRQNYSDLKTQFSNAQNEISTLKEKINGLTNFKNKVEKGEKQKMIDSFYMLSDKDKEDVIKNIDTYSLDDIEAKLSIICVRNKVNFNLDNDKDKNPAPITYNLNNNLNDDVPEWVRAIRSVANTI